MNPFDMVYDALWQMLLSHPVFERDVKTGNRVRYDIKTDRDPMKDTIAAGDLPEVVLASDTVSGNLMQTSSTSMVTKRFSVLVSTGDFRAPILTSVEWCIFTALTGWPERLGALTWKQQRFVKRVQLVSAQSGLSDAAANRNIKGWAAKWVAEVEMHFSTLSLREELNLNSVV